MRSLKEYRTLWLRQRTRKCRPSWQAQACSVLPFARTTSFPHMDWACLTTKIGKIQTCDLRRYVLLSRANDSCRAIGKH